MHTHTHARTHTDTMLHSCKGKVTFANGERVAHRGVYQDDPIQLPAPCDSDSTVPVADWRQSLKGKFAFFWQTPEGHVHADGRCSTYTASLSEEDPGVLTPPVPDGPHALVRPLLSALHASWGEGGINIHSYTTTTTASSTATGGDGVRCHPRRYLLAPAPRAAGMAVCITLRVSRTAVRCTV